MGIIFLSKFLFEINSPKKKSKKIRREKRSMNPYRLDHSKALLHIDEIFDLYQKTKYYVGNLLESDPKKVIESLWDPKTSIFIDKTCHHHLLSENSSLLRNIYRQKKCVHCLIFERISQKTSLPSPYFQIESGKYQDKKLYLDTIRNIHTHLSWVESYEDQDHTDYDRTKSIVSDKFSNRLLIDYYLQYDLRNSPIRYHLYSILSGFICGDTGYRVFRNPDIDSLTSFIQRVDNFDQLDLHQMIIQLFTILDKLSSHNLTIINVDSKLLKFDLSPVKYDKFEVHSLDSRFRLILDISDQVAITLEDKDSIRLRPTNYLSINSLSSSEIQSSSGWYRLSKQIQNFDISNEILKEERYEGKIQNSSIEGYLFFMLLMKNKKIGQMIWSDPQLLKIWKGLWKSNEYKQINKDIDEMEKEEILMNYELRYDSIKFILSSMVS